MIVIEFHSEKGGTGKTTLSTLASGLLAARGLNVVHIDLDPQGHSSLSLGVGKAQGVFRVLAYEDVHIWSELVSVRREVYAPGGAAEGNLWLLPGDGATRRISPANDEVDVLAENLADLEDEQSIDVVILDTPPSAETLPIFAHYAADYIVIPSRMEFLSMDGIAATIKTAAKWNVALMGIVPNMVKRAGLHAHHFSELQTAAQNFGWSLFPAIGDRIEWAEASTLQTLIYTLEGPASKGRQEAVQFANRIYEQVKGVEDGIR